MFEYMYPKTLITLKIWQSLILGDFFLFMKGMDVLFSL